MKKALLILFLLVPFVVWGVAANAIRHSNGTAGTTPTDEDLPTDIFVRDLCIQNLSTTVILQYTTSAGDKGSVGSSIGLPIICFNDVSIPRVTLSTASGSADYDIIWEGTTK